MPTVCIYGLTGRMEQERRQDLRNSIRLSVSRVAALKVREQQVSVRFIHEDTPDSSDKSVAFTITDLWYSDARADADASKTVVKSIGALIKQYLREWPCEGVDPEQVEGQVQYVGSNAGDAIYPDPKTLPKADDND